MSEKTHSAVQATVRDLDTAGLVALAQEGSQEAFSVLYERYFERVYSYLRVALNDDDHEAQDATQQVFTQVLAALPDYEQQGEPWRAWLFRIARNLAVDRLRKSGRVEVTEPAAIESLRQPVADEDMRALGWTSDGELMMLIDRLPEAQRQVITLRYVLGFNGPETAQILDRSPGAVRQLHHRALRFLEHHLTALSREPGGQQGGRRLPMTAHSRQGALEPPHGFTIARLA